MYRVGLIGAGNMGRAMLRAWIALGTLKTGEIEAIDKDPGKAEEVVSEFGVTRARSIGELAAGSGIVVLAVKPQDSGIVLEELAGRLDESQVLMSIAAGLTISSMRRELGPGPSIVRVMPNMGALVGAAASAFAVETGPGGLDRAEVRALLEAIGEVVEVEESSMNLVTALSGSGPAYFFYLTEALEEAAIGQGMSPEVASLLARQTLWGAAKTVMEAGREPGELRRAVSSPGGTTLAALSEMDSGGFMQMMARALKAAADRAGELAG